MRGSTNSKKQGVQGAPTALRRAVRVVLKSLILTTVLFWVAPFLSVTVPGAAFSRDSVAILACVVRIPDALSIVAEERQRTAAEQAAFKDLSARVATLDTTELESTSATVGAALRNSGTGATAPLEDVRAAYRDTVMAVSHYEEEYDEPLAESMAAELGQDLAAIVNGNDVLTPQLQEALVQASDTARQDRKSFRQTLDHEHDVLTDACRQLRDISDTTERLATTPLGQRSFDDILGVEGRLQSLKVDCEETLRDRQQQLHDRPSRDGVRLQEYLYAPRSWTFPILDDTLDCLSRLREVERRIVRTVSRRL